MIAWSARQVASDSSGAEFFANGWKRAWTASAGMEYYLRPRVAFDLGLRYHRAAIPGRPVERGGIGTGADDLRFLTLWIGHYVRF